MQAPAVACGEEKIAIAVWPRGLAMRVAKFITQRAGASACGGLCDSARRGTLGWGGLRVNLTSNPLAKLHPATHDIPNLHVSPNVSDIFCKNAMFG